MNLNKSLFAVLLAFFIGGSPKSFSQFHQPHRFEQELNNSDEGFTIISLKKEGLALIRDLNKYNRSNKKWQLEIVDTTLSKLWSTELELENRLILVGYEYSPRHLYLLFREGEAELHNFQLLTIPFHEKTIQTDIIKFEMNFRMTNFTVAGNSAVFGGVVSNEAAVLLYNQSSNQPKVLPGLFVNDMNLLDVRANQNQSFNVLLTEVKGKDKKKLIIRTYDQDGNLLIDDVILIDPPFNILSGLTSTLERDEMVIAGTYGIGTSKQASGFFSVVVDPFNEQPVTYIDLSSLEHTLDYLSPRKAEKTRAKALKQKTLGHIPDYKAYVIPFRIEERPDGFYLLAEQYYPTSNINPYPYSYNYYNPYSYGYYPYGLSPYMRNYPTSPYMYNSTARNSDVRTVQTMALKLGSHGKFEKDNSLKLINVKQPGLEQVGDFIVAHDSILLAYKNESDIFIQKEKGDLDEIRPVEKIKIKLADPLDVLRNENENEGGIRHWYDNHFYIWGYQNIRNTTRSQDPSRHVFYINRFSLE